MCEPVYPMPADPGGPFPCQARPVRRYNQRRSVHVAILAGIDEAGYGPVLGPLVVSAAVFELSEELLFPGTAHRHRTQGESSGGGGPREAHRAPTPVSCPRIDLWQLLAREVCRKPSRHHKRIAFADSKKLYSRRKPNALAHLERGVLSMLAASGRRPRALSELLAEVAPGSADAASCYPWYVSGNGSLPRCMGATDVALSGNALSVAMGEASVRPVGLRSEVVFAGEFNRLVEATRNKAVGLFSVTARLLHRVWRKAEGGRARVYVDRQGGRTHYRRLLQQLLPGREMKVLSESDAGSAYRVTDARRTVEFVFSASAEDRHLPVALASMTSKYLRELFMERLNAYWSAEVPGLSPTAGYFTDGRRFYEQILPAVQRLGAVESMLYRSR